MNSWTQDIAAKREAIYLKAAEREAQRQAANERRASLKLSDSPDLIGEFNKSYMVQEILLQAGYEQHGSTFRHPQSESGSFSANVKNERVHSLSTSDPLFTDGEGAHDAFSAFCVLFHAGDQNEALKDAGGNWLAIGVAPWNKVKRKEYAKNNSKKSSTSNTSNTGNGFRGINPALNQHQSNTSPMIDSDSLIVCVETKSGERKSLLIESKAAEILKESLTGFLSHDTKSQTWYEFVDSHWGLLASPQHAEQWLVELIYIGAGDLGFKTAYKNGIKSLLCDGDMLPLPKPNHKKLPFANGLLDLKTRKIEPVTPENAQTWCLPYEYKEGADCLTIKDWLKLAVDEDIETVNYLRAWMAAVLHGRNDLQKFLHLKGSGGTGKGTFMRLLTELIGNKNTAITSLEQLEQNRFETATLYNKRLAVISDSDKYGGSINNLKAITGQDHIRLERKHQQQAGSFIFPGLVVMASNESLQVTDHTSGLDRRRITVIFDRRATHEEKQAWESQGGEAAVLHSELPGLVNWLLELSPDEISHIIFNPPERIRQADIEAMTASNSIADWVIECCESDPSAWTQIGDKREIRKTGNETIYKNANIWLYANFLQWCSRANKVSFSSRRFKDLLIQTCETLGISTYEARRNSGRGICGLRIKNHDQS